MGSEMCIRDSPISVRFVAPPIAAPVASPTLQSRLKALVLKHWPSVAVLLIGLVLLTIMTRQSQYDDGDADDLMDEDIISINSTTEVSNEVSGSPLPEVALAQPDDYARRAAEEKLGSLVEKDPDSAARVIESWIRNAG